MSVKILKNSAIALLALAVVGVALDSAHAETRLWLAHKYPQSSSTGRIVNKFIEAVARRSQGTIRVEPVSFTSSNIREEILIRAVKEGLPDMALVGSSFADEVNAFRIFELPYLIRSRRSVELVTPLLTAPHLTESRGAGFDVLTVLDGGFRQINSARPVEHDTDLKGLRIATVGPERSSGVLRTLTLTTQFFVQLGAEPVSLPEGEVKKAIQTSYVKAVDATLTEMISSGSAEALEYVTLTGHVYSPLYLIMNSQKRQQLTPSEVESLQTAAADAQLSSFQIGEDADGSALHELKRRGIRVITLSENDRLRLESQGRRLYDRFTRESGGGTELLYRILAALRNSS
jgi:TRAP-type transport system periplasmic protein